MTFVSLVALSLVACTPVGADDGGRSTCDAVCADTTSIAVGLDVPRADLPRLRVRVCRNGSCSEGNARLVEGGEKNGDACSLVGDLAGVSGSIKDHELRLEVRASGTHDGDLFTVDVSRQDTGAMLVSRHGTATYHPIELCGTTCAESTVQTVETTHPPAVL